ncbi:TetR/AcrR family transcriptional regulator [Streptomyces sp. NPDC002491]
MTLAPRKARRDDNTRSKRKGDRTRALILDAAEQLFAEGGYNATSLNAVAEKVGITQPAVLYHFPSKEALLLGLLSEREEPAMDDDSEGLAVIDALNDLFHKSLNDPQLVRLFTVVLIEGLAADHPAHLFVKDRYEEVHADLLTRLRRGVATGRIRPDADLDQDTTLMSAVMDGLSIQWLLNPSVDVTAAFDRFAQLLRADLAAADPAPSAEPPR